MNSNQENLYLAEDELMELDQQTFQDGEENSDDESDEETEKLVFDIQNFQNIQEERNDDESDYEWGSDKEEIDEEIDIPDYSPTKLSPCVIIDNSSGKVSQCCSTQHFSTTCTALWNMG
ncbi:11925_t:CDS:1, partial [Entrophospora sp. SA101]